MKRASKIKIVVMDDRPVVLSGLRAWFDSHERFRIAAGANNSGQLSARLESANYDLILLNGGIETSDAGRLALLRALRDAWRNVPVVMSMDERDLTASGITHYVGLAGLVSVRDDMRALERVCDRVLSGAKGVMSPRIEACCTAAHTLRTFGSGEYSGVRVRVRSGFTPA